MKYLGQGIALTLLGAGLAALPGLEAQAAPTAPVDSRSIVQKMKDEAKGSVTFTKEEANGKVGFVRAGINGDLLQDFDGSPVAKADAYLDEYAAAFGATPGQLRRSPEVLSSKVGTTVTYTQTYQGLPVFGSTLRAQVDKGGDLTAVNGFAVPNLKLSVNPRLSAKDAGNRAVAAVTDDPPTHEGAKAAVKGLKAKSADLSIYRTGSTRATNGENKLVYVVEVTNGNTIRDIVFVDAQTDKLLNRYSMVHNDLEREIYEEAYTEANKVYDEGDGDDPDTLNEDQRNIYEGSGEAYWFFQNAFDRDSYDGEGAVMRIVNNDPTIACPNANWNGTTTNYCNGVTSDDVVAHEWGHAYTEKTHGLIYQYQPGALNESYSDIWGETVDLINGRMDDDEGDITTKRPDGQCSKYTRGGITATINSPAGVAGPCEAAAAAAFGPVFDQAGTTSDVVVATDVDEDAADPANTTTDGCSAFSNAGAIDGKFAYADRGGCTFSVKVANAEDAGATGIVVGDNVAGRAPISMTGESDIYGLMVTKGDGDKIKSVGTVNMTVVDSDTDAKADSYRWLQGEDSTAFGGAIRDLWTPTCYGDPGKVSDAEYFCGTEDGGGVHSNSGVPNHGYALTVDGGTYNGRTITGIGMTKAAAVYFRAMTNYQTPTTDFADHADALAASCTDLIGQPLKELSTDPNDSAVSSETISSTDCATFGAVADAVEFRAEPTQCDYQPMFNQDRPALCEGKGRGSFSVFKETFTKGIPSDWDADVTSAFGHPGAPWVADATAPTGNGPAHPGGVAYGPAPDQGTCNGSEADFSTRDGLISKIITMPDQKLKAPKLSFDQYMATEVGFDGGNVKYRINGGAFQVIPTAAYINNGPAGNLATEAAGNTNPLAGQPGFTGTDGGSPFGSWAQSQVDLSMLGLAGGDELELRFDIGRDGCGGNDGWYVDNVAVTICKVKTKVDAVQKPRPSKYGKAAVVKVEVAPVGATGTVPGTVVLYNSKGKAVDRARLTNGKASFKLRKGLAVGRRTVTVKYLGDANYLTDSDRAAVIVRRR